MADAATRKPTEEASLVTTDTCRNLRSSDHLRAAVAAAEDLNLEKNEFPSGCYLIL